jgi:uncharacterized membrane protein (UPF0127 family)
MPMASLAAHFSAWRGVSRSPMARKWSAARLWGVVVIASLTACTAGSGAPTSSDVLPVTSGPDSTGLAGQTPIGFGEVGLRIVSDTAAGLREAEMCVWEAASAEQRSRGLMWVTDLGGRDGMVFVYDEDRSTSFTMRNTVLPLSIAFFDASGAFMDAFDMEPCASEPCPGYPTPVGFRLAVEVPAGDLDRWGITAGARAAVRPRCDTP